MKTPTQPPSAEANAGDATRLPEGGKKKRYAPPAIAEEEAFEAITLGTMPSQNAHFGC